MAGNIKKVLIVDDEYFVGKLIEKLIKWEDMSLECVGILDNGQDAVDFIKDNAPDIVITDIKMPGISGLDLIKETRSVSNKLQYIIISGYREFEYARAAMKYGIDHYVLKPINEEDLNEALSAVIKIIDDKENKEAGEKRLIEALESSEKIIKTNILKNIIENGDSERDTIFDTNTGLFRAVNIKLDYENIKHIDNKQDKITVNKIVEITNKILESEVSEVIGCDKEFMNIYFLFNYDFSDTGKIKNLLNEILIKINEYLLGFERYRATIGVGDEKAEFNDIKFSIKEAHEAITKRLCFGINRIIFYRDLANSENILPEIRYSEIFNKYKNELKRGIESFSIDKVKYIINSIFSEFTQISLINTDEIYSLPERAAELFLEYEDENLSKKKSEMNILLNSCWNINECKSVLIQYITDCIDYLKDKSEIQILKPVRLMISYIEENYKEKITIEDTSNIVKLNPVYLGSLFKKETGLSFSNYLINIRIEKAKKLLVETDYTIAAIGSEVGYKDTRYFSQLFTKTVGIKPALYRRLHS